MTPEDRLRKVFDLNAFAEWLFEDGLRERFPEVSEDELRRLMRERIAKCYNRNY